MKKVIHFSKLFVPFTILSAVLILGGVVSLFTRGINFGIDFKPGLIEEIRIAPAAVSLTYHGPASVTVQNTSQSITFVVSGIGAENMTYAFSSSAYPTIEDMAAAFSSVPGVSVSVSAPAGTPSGGLFGNSEASNLLGSEPYLLHYIPPEDSAISADDVRSALSGIPDVSVKVLGNINDRNFQIRVGDSGETGGSEASKTAVLSALASAFGGENIAVIKTDFIGSQYSASLAFQAILLVAASLFLIWLYAAIRFRWDFALGAVIAIIHDALIMVAFITWTQMEFTTTTIAAILTIVGYSINDTVVVLDRVRENMKMLKAASFKELLDISQTEILSRTVITTVTTLLAVLSLYIFTTGTMKDFALALIVGMISGVYSTIFIASAFIAAVRKNWKPGDGLKKSGSPVTAATV